MQAEIKREGPRSPREWCVVKSALMMSEDWGRELSISLTAQFMMRLISKTKLCHNYYTKYTVFFSLCAILFFCVLLNERGPLKHWEPRLCAIKNKDVRLGLSGEEKIQLISATSVFLQGMLFSTGLRICCFLTGVQWLANKPDCLKFSISVKEPKPFH